MNVEQAREIIKEVRKNKKINQMLADKCNWEQMTPTSVVMEWGDPRRWEETK